MNKAFYSGSKIHICEFLICPLITRTGQALTIIFNNTISPISLKFFGRIKAPKFVKKLIWETDFIDLGESPEQTLDILKLLQTEHSKTEGQIKLLELYKTKQKIKTLDETSIYSQSYKYSMIALNVYSHTANHWHYHLNTKFNHQVTIL